jgi:hypothetical protein
MRSEFDGADRRASDLLLAMILKQSGSDLNPLSTYRLLAHTSKSTLKIERLRDSLDQYLALV